MPSFQRVYLDEWTTASATTPIEELDFDVPCESTGVAHEPIPAADWILWRVQCCERAPEALMVCEACRQLMLAQPVAWYAFCGWRFTPMFASIIRAEPIKHIRPPRAST